MPACSYSRRRYSASAQKCGGVQAKMMRNRSSGWYGHVARDRGPAQHGRHRPGRAADHDVLRRGGLENHRVDDRVAHERGEREPHGERVHRVPQDGEPESPDGAGHEEDLRRRDRAHDRGPPPRARHHGVELVLDETVEGGGRSRHERDARGRVEHGDDRRQPRRGEQHADHRREDDERHDAWLGEAPELSEHIRRALDRLCRHR